VKFSVEAKNANRLRLWPIEQATVLPIGSGYYRPYPSLPGLDWPLCHCAMAQARSPSKNAGAPFEKKFPKLLRELP